MLHTQVVGHSAVHVIIKLRGPCRLGRRLPRHERMGVPVILTGTWEKHMLNNVAVSCASLDSESVLFL